MAEEPKENQPVGQGLTGQPAVKSQGQGGSRKVTTAALLVLAAVALAGIYLIRNYAVPSVPENELRPVTGSVPKQPTTNSGAGESVTPPPDWAWLNDESPISWGELVKLETMKKNQNGQPVSAEVAAAEYSTGIRAYFQQGVDIIVYNKLVRQGSCTDLAKLEKFDNPESWGEETCYVTESGSYDPKSGKTVVFDLPSSLSAYPAAFTTGFRTPGLSGQLRRIAFSPTGRYFAAENAVPLIEGCSVSFIDTATGKRLRSGSSVKDEEYLDFSCDPVVHFSVDDSVLAVVSNYNGMQSPASSFVVAQSGKSWQLLPKILKQQDYYVGEDTDLTTVITVQSVTAQEVNFSVAGDNTLFENGLYKLSLPSGMLDVR